MHLYFILLSWIYAYEVSFCFIFIAIPFSNVNPGAFPEDLKSEHRTIKLIEAARYQLRCSRPWQHILHWPFKTFTLCCLSKFNLWPAAIDSAAVSLSFWTSLTETLTSLITMLVKVPCSGSDMDMMDWQSCMHLLPSQWCSLWFWCFVNNHINVSFKICF